MPNGDFQTWVSGLQHMQTWATGLRHVQTWATGLQNASVGVCERLRFRCAHAVCGLSSVRCPRRADRACTKRVGSTHLGQCASWALPKRPHFFGRFREVFFGCTEYLCVMCGTDSTSHQGTNVWLHPYDMFVRFRMFRSVCRVGPSSQACGLRLGS